MTAVCLDVTQFLAHPLRSGIQRVERETLRQWPTNIELVPVCLHGNGQYFRISDEAVEVLGSPTLSEAQSRERLDGVSASIIPLTSDEISCLLTIELFYHRARADAHISLAASGVPIAYFVYDFLPHLQPRHWPQGTPRGCMHYLRALRDTGSRTSFLSPVTREEFGRYIARVSDPISCGPVFCPGADGLCLERQAFSPGRNDFAVIGTVEPRKNVGAILQAFDRLWISGSRARLVLAGRIVEGDDLADERALLAKWSADERLEVHHAPSDETLRAILRRARAVLMASEAEGFGLPPYEGLYCGIPAIASAKLACAPLLGRGAFLLDQAGVDQVARAVALLSDDDVADALWREAAGVKLPTWRVFANDLAHWALTQSRAVT